MSLIQQNSAYTNIILPNLSIFSKFILENNFGFDKREVTLVMLKLFRFD